MILLVINSSFIAEHELSFSSSNVKVNLSSIQWMIRLYSARFNDNIENVISLLMVIDLNSNYPIYGLMQK